MENRGSINVRGKLIGFDKPRVMGIINVTPDSFYSGSRHTDEESVLKKAESMLSAGADFIDIGGCSTRPGATAVSADEEKKRVLGAVRLISAEFPEAIISVDTFRAEIALEAVSECGASMINDITGGDGDSEMFSVVSKLNVPYILMHMQGTPETMQHKPVYDDIISDILQWFGKRIARLHSTGVKDIILDPGFGFGKSIENNFELLRRFRELRVAGHLLLAGLSRKSLIWKTLGSDPSGALNGTTVLNTAALLNGADILRVHDVKEALEAIKLVSELRGLSPKST
jgi:dihydropteroate synthase